jgi:hypothetical protein
MPKARDFPVNSPVKKGISFYTNGMGIFFNEPSMIGTVRALLRKSRNIGTEYL